MTEIHLVKQRDEMSMAKPGQLSSTQILLRMLEMKVVQHRASTYQSGDMTSCGCNFTPKVSNISTNCTDRMSRTLLPLSETRYASSWSTASVTSQSFVVPAGRQFTIEKEKETGRGIESESEKEKKNNRIVKQKERGID